MNYKTSLIFSVMGAIFGAVLVIVGIQVGIVVLSIGAILVLIAFIFLINGIYSFVLYKKGHDDTCVVIRKEMNYHLSTHTSYPIWELYIEYKGDSGKTHEKKIPVSKNEYDSINEGAKIACKIYKESIYIDDEPRLTIVKENES